ncbi:CPBP family intramembrane glutamic endopeptidase, partial [Glutamicibacter sp.]|uniref:CPBP family intramembrane glutamic endopeptidase n=1 Tax=Glutamicibacter sp. TaxID=1931995 RepID=UPI0028BD8EF1
MQRWKITNSTAILIFMLLSCFLAWLVALPIWVDGGLNNSRFTLFAVAMMSTPTIAAVVVCAIEARMSSFVRDVGLWPLKYPKRLLWCLLLAIALPVFLTIQAVYIGTWLGTFPGDLKNFTILHFLAGSQGTGAYLMSQVGSILLATLVNLLPAMGEEIGWRGWLWPRLQKYGRVPAIFVSGVIWGLWHAPLILLGYNYPFAEGAWGLVFMCGMCIVVGAFFGWLRTISGSVWPCAMAHADSSMSVKQQSEPFHLLLK